MATVTVLAQVEFVRLSVFHVSPPLKKQRASGFFCDWTEVMRIIVCLVHLIEHPKCTPHTAHKDRALTDNKQHRPYLAGCGG